MIHSSPSAAPFHQKQAQLLSSSNELGANYVPGEFDVLCARGKQATNHPGNKFFRAVVDQHRERYASVTSKWERSRIVSEIIELIRSKGNGFVKQEKSGEWTVTSDLLAREKVGQLFRSTAGQYKSSFQNKKARRRCVTTKLAENLHKVIVSNASVIFFVSY